MKKQLITILFIVALVFPMTGGAKNVATPIGIIGALPEEIIAIQAIMKNSQETTVNNKKIYSGTIKGHPVVLVQSGVGKVNGAATTQLLITKYGITQAVFTGVAGGINPRNRVGDVVIAKRLSQQDYGIVTPSGKEIWKAGTLFGAGKIEDTWFYLNQSKLFRKLIKASYLVKLNKVPKELAKTKSYKPKIRVGTIVTGDEFVASEKKRKWLETTFQADAIEMEGAAFAQVCANNQIDCVVIRTISDLANENSHVDFPKFAAYAAANSAKLVDKLLAIY